MQEHISTACPGCKIVLPVTNYPADNRYGVSSAACRQAFDEILVKEGELFGYPAVHRLIIDAYNIQHPPHAEVQKELGISKRFIDASVQSVGIHLIALYLALEKKMDLRKIAGQMDTVLHLMEQRGATFKNFTPPTSLGETRAADVRNALYTADDTSLQEYELLAGQWAREAWKAWHQHHAVIEAWYNMYSK